MGGQVGGGASGGGMPHDPFHAATANEFPKVNGHRPKDDCRKKEFTTINYRS